MNKLMLTVVAGALSLAVSAAAPRVTFRAASAGPQQLAADADYASFEAVVPIGAADSVSLTVRGADGKPLCESRQEVKTGRNPLALHVESLAPGRYDVLMRAFRGRGQVAIATNSFVKQGAAMTVAKDKTFVFASDGSRAEMAPGKIRALDLTPLAGVGTPRGAPIVAVADGVARLAIVATEAHGQARWLAEVIERMTGAAVPVVNAGTNDLYKAGPAIYVGNARATQEAGFRRPGTPDSRWGVGAHAFRCVTKGSDVFILGANGGATGYGVYDFAERVLGVRQYLWCRGGKTPQETAWNRAVGEDVIKTEGLAIPQFDWSDKPVYEFRTEFAAGHAGWKFGDAHQAAHTVHAPHYWHTDPSMNLNGRWSSYKDVFEMDGKGKRGQSPMLCYGNPRTLEVYKRHIDLTIAGKRAGFAGDPVNVGRKTVTVSQWDAAVVCHCDYCKKLRRDDMAPTGDASPIIWGYFTKELAKWMKKKYPDWRISILPYINTCEVPPGVDFRAEGNVDAYVCTMPGLALLAQDGCRKDEEALIRRWAKCTGNPVQDWHYICWPADKTCAPYLFGSTAVRFYREMKGDICGSFINGGCRDRHVLSLYVWARAMWNPGFEAKNVYDEYARRFFGPAAVPMRKVIDMQEKGWERPWQRPTPALKNIFGISYPRKEVEEMEKLFAESEKLVKGQELYERRLAWYKEGFKQFFKESYEYATAKAFPPLMMRKVGDQPKLDGILDDACWKLAEPSGVFTLAGALGSGTPTNLVSRYPTTMKAVWTAEGVVLGVDCTEKTPDRIVTNRPAGDWWGNDCLEIFIDFTGQNEGQFGKLWIDAVNQLRAYGCKGTKWAPKGLKSGAAITKTGWSCEIFIPYSDLGAYEGAQKPEGTAGAGRKWTGNVCRLRIADAWAKTGRTEGSVWELQRLNTRFSVWNNDCSAFSDWTFVEQ